VQPAATIPIISKHSGALVIEINTEPTPLTHSVSDYLIAGRAGEMMHRIVTEVERKKRQG
ncbi:MAG: NAD-dependent protein deacylase, partial [Desulfobacterales bacterium]